MVPKLWKSFEILKKELLQIVAEYAIKNGIKICFEPRFLGSVLASLKPIKNKSSCREKTAQH